MRPGDSWRRYAFRSLGASFRRSRGTCVKQHEKSRRVQCQPRSQGFSFLNWVGQFKRKSPGNEVIGRALLLSRARCDFSGCCRAS